MKRSGMLGLFSLAFIVLLIASLYYGFVDLTVTLFLGLFIGALVVSQKFNKLFGFGGAIVLGLVVGYLLFQILPYTFQFLQILASLGGQGAQLNLAYQQNGLPGLIAVAGSARYIVPGLNAVMCVLGYGLAVLVYPNGKRKR